MSSRRGLALRCEPDIIPQELTRHQKETLPMIDKDISEILLMTHEDKQSFRDYWLLFPRRRDCFWEDPPSLSPVSDLNAMNNLFNTTKRYKLSSSSPHLSLYRTGPLLSGTGGNDKHSQRAPTLCSNCPCLLVFFSAWLRARDSRETEHK